jgi:hypothetical protein
MAITNIVINEQRPGSKFNKIRDIPGAGSAFRLEDEVVRVERDGLRHIDLHLGIGIGVG